MAPAALAEYRKLHVPLYNDNRLKLGMFAMNVSSGMAITKAPTSLQINWDYQLRLAQRADDLGFEAYVPVARWRGVGGDIDYHGENFEPLTFAAAVAASTTNLMPFATVHAPVIHPIVAAKMAATIDHVSRGRFGLNVVMGWFVPEFEMFGIQQYDHERRYQFGSEWLDVVDRLWAATEPFDYKGEFFEIASARSYPRPIQPRPVVFNAGSSPTGAAWAARHADFNFTGFTTTEDASAYVSALKSSARSEHGRDVGVLTYAFIVCRDTEREAQQALQRILEDADWEATDNWLTVLGIESGSFDAHMRGELMRQFVAGAGAARIVGTPEQVVEQLQNISDSGIDGVLLGFLNPDEELAYFGEKVMPLLKGAGLRA